MIFIENNYDLYNLNKGNVGIGTTSPGNLLTLDHSTNSLIQIAAAGTQIGFLGQGNQAVSGGASTDFGLRAPNNLLFAAGGSGEDMRITTAGNVGIGTTEPGSRLEVENTASADDVLLLEDSSGLCEAQPTTTGLTWSCSSDERLKANIRGAEPVLDYLTGIPLKSYTVIKTGENKTGPIAQDLLKTNPELVRQGDDGYYQVSELSQWTLVKAIQELKEENEGLKEENGAMKSDIEILKQDVQKLKIQSNGGK